MNLNEPLKHVGFLSNMSNDRFHQAFADATPRSVPELAQLPFLGQIPRPTTHGFPSHTVPSDVEPR